MKTDGRAAIMMNPSELAAWESDNQSKVEAVHTISGRDLVEAQQGSLSCGGMFIPSHDDYTPFHKRFKSLHLSNQRQQIVLLKNLKPYVKTALQGDIDPVVFEEREEQNPMARSFRMNQYN